MHTLRTRIKKKIVSEFLPPVKKSNKVIILCGGMPSYPGKKETLEFLSKKGYWTFSPRYRGSWESEGSFLERSPENDVLDVVDQLSVGFLDIWSKRLYKIKTPLVYLIGSSFGGPAVILASRDSRVKKGIVFSPVTDWRLLSETESLGKIRAFTKDAFGPAYRIKEKNWRKLKNGKFYNPAGNIGSIDGEKLIIIHAKDDKSIPFKSSVRFADQSGCRLMLKKTGGHLSISSVTKTDYWEKIKYFLGT